jgi:hypothetical protein
MSTDTDDRMVVLAAKRVQSNGTKVAAQMRRIADSIDREIPSDLTKIIARPIAVAYNVQHELTWGVANCGMDSLLSACDELAALERQLADERTAHTELLAFITDQERRHFRTEHDTGANTNALFLHNQLRKLAGLPELQVSDLTSAEEYTDRTRDAISEREYPLMPRGARPGDQCDETCTADCGHCKGVHA